MIGHLEAALRAPGRTKSDTRYVQTRGIPIEERRADGGRAGGGLASPGPNRTGAHTEAALPTWARVPVSVRPGGSLAIFAPAPIARDSSHFAAPVKIFPRQVTINAGPRDTFRGHGVNSRASLPIGGKCPLWTLEMCECDLRWKPKKRASFPTILE